YNTQYAAQVLGYVGKMDDTDYTGADGKSGYKALGYSYGAVVGKSGAEQAFERYLHGTDGIATDTRTADGTLVSTAYKKAPVPGDNIYLTIDIGLQETAEVALASKIQEMNAQREADNAKYEQTGQTDKIMQMSAGGAVVAIDIATGEPLCIASFPTFDPSDYLDQAKFAALNVDTTGPLINRALSGLYPPGSTFKPITGLAALSDPTSGVTVDTTVYDAHTFHFASDPSYAPTCWAPYSHGDENMTRAIRDSCNFYFFTIGNWTGISKIDAVAKAFGLGQPTGIELTEATGQVAGPEAKAAQGKRLGWSSFESQWFDGDTVSAAIGQSISVFTPIQLANYVATFASDGNHNKLSLLKSVRSFDYSTEVYTHSPALLNKCDYDPSFYQAIQEGMREEIAGPNYNQTVHNVFATANYTVAAKTGTAQLGPGQTDNGVFICYAPFDKPEIAVAVAVEKGGSGAALAEIARAVLDYYFSFKNSTTAIDQDLALLK
ncbi:MAG: penicillin-binding transpeptidase domain-containing protein, partial [Firmicutes bacterium]|nr:penicillin-binding transpeptidase domain-containing protein [Bacillota bacterium]